MPCWHLLASMWVSLPVRWRFRWRGEASSTESRWRDVCRFFPNVGGKFITSRCTPRVVCFLPPRSFSHGSPSTVSRASDPSLGPEINPRAALLQQNQAAYWTSVGGKCSLRSWLPFNAFPRHEQCILYTYGLKSGIVQMISTTLLCVCRFIMLILENCWWFILRAPPWYIC